MKSERGLVRVRISSDNSNKKNGYRKDTRNLIVFKLYMTILRWIVYFIGYDKNVR